MSAEAKRDDGSEVVLLVVQRDATREDRVTLSTYQGARFINVRGWEKGTDGKAYPMPKRGFSIRRRDVGDFIAALMRGLRMLSGERTEPANDPIPFGSDSANDAPTNEPPQWLKDFHERRDRTREPAR